MTLGGARNGGVVSRVMAVDYAVAKAHDAVHVFRDYAAT